MAKRPAWTIENDHVICEEFEFEWNGGFALVQKQKNIDALHASIRQTHPENGSALEVSSKGKIPLGNSIGAFSLKCGDVCLENVFQAAKQYEEGGPFPDLLDVSPKEAKQDERHHNSGKLIAFSRNGEKWPLEPKTLFYDYIYVCALTENFGYNLDLNRYRWFTDIEFNPKKSVNCQARSVAIYQLMQKLEAFDEIRDRKRWQSFHIRHVKG